jgi:hypothetical protein
MKNLFLLSILLSFSPLLLSQNVGIGTNNPSSKLDVAGDLEFSGTLKPGNSAGTLGQFLISQGAGSTPIWQTIVTGSDGWKLTGNSGTVPGSNFIGTTDAQNLQFKTNNITALTIGNTNQNIGIGTAISTARLSVSQSAIPNTSALTASNSSANPSVLINNLGNEDGSGLEVYITPVTQGNFATAIYGESLDGNAGEGVAIWGVSGDYGLVGQSNGGNNIGVFSLGSTGATGTKAFKIDYPLDPENKTLSHYSIESNEILNVYRGTIAIDSNGQAQVVLPEYFSAVNTNPSYQLTAIGSPTQPYIATEIENNTFTIAGAPFSKVSWTVYAERNDPTVQYYIKQNNLKQTVRVKRDTEKGKYLTPEAYGKDKSEGIFFKPEREKTN